MRINTILILLFLTSCTPSIYYVTTDTDLRENNSKPNPYKLIYLDPDMAGAGKPDSIAEAINRKKWKRLETQAKALNTQEQKFLLSIRYLISKEYLASYQTLTSLDDEAFDCQVKILKTDCLKELGADTVDFRAHYQKALDCTRSEKIKTIINTRYRFLRYGQ